MEAKIQMPEDAGLNSSHQPRISPLNIFISQLRYVFRYDKLGAEIAQIAIPAALALTADPIASLIDTAFIGQIGPVELAAVGVSIAVFNQVSRVAIFPLVSITTSFVAEEDARSMISSDDAHNNSVKGRSGNRELKELIPTRDSEETTRNALLCAGAPESVNNSVNQRKKMPSVSTALILGCILGFLQAVLLIAAAKPLLQLMGLKSDSSTLIPAQRYLTLRSLGSPAVLLSLAVQGIFRGFKDTKTPLYATVAGDLTNIILDPILMFIFHLGIRGAAIAHVASQYLILLILLLRLRKQVDILPPDFRDLEFSRFLKSGTLLLGRVVAVTFCTTLAASLAAREGSISMAAFQVCLQVWLATSLLADGLAVAGQTIIATAFAIADHERVMAATSRVLQLGLVLGGCLSIVLGFGMQFGSRLFTKDPHVMKLMHKGIPFIAATQPINSLAFVLDGINFGASDFAYAAYSMILVALASVLCLCLLAAKLGFVGIWIGLTIYMILRAAAGFWRIGTANGPWVFLRSGKIT